MFSFFSFETPIVLSVILIIYNLLKHKSKNNKNRVSN